MLIALAPFRCTDSKPDQSLDPIQHKLPPPQKKLPSSRPTTIRRFDFVLNYRRTGALPTWL